MVSPWGLISDDPPIPPEGPQTTLMHFVDEDGRWLANGVFTFTDLMEDDGTAAPTGTAIPATS
jgi:hypothetical protein